MLYTGVILGGVSDIFHITQPFIEQGLPCSLCTFYPKCSHTDITIHK